MRCILHIRMFHNIDLTAENCAFGALVWMMNALTATVSTASAVVARWVVLTLATR